MNQPITVHGRNGDYAAEAGATLYWTDTVNLYVADVKLVGVAAVTRESPDDAPVFPRLLVEVRPSDYEGRFLVVADPQLFRTRAAAVESLRKVLSLRVGNGRRALGFDERRLEAFEKREGVG